MPSAIHLWEDIIAFPSRRHAVLKVFKYMSMYNYIGGIQTCKIY